MPTTCVLVAIHGIGNQPSSWAQAFEASLNNALAALPSPADPGRFRFESVWWADLSIGPGTGMPAALTATPSGQNSVTYSVAYNQFVQYLAAGGMISPAVGTPSSLDILGWAQTALGKIMGTAVTAADLAGDVANYIGDNAIRVAIQNRLFEKLFAVNEQDPGAKVILGSHSQGTIISYDVLRLVADHMPWLTTWVTMGCPLGWYQNVCWGDERVGIPPSLDWRNYYDRNDVVGRQLAPLISWAGGPQPQDDDVDNCGHGLDAHDHWANQGVVQRYAKLIQPLIS